MRVGGDLRSLNRVQDPKLGSCVRHAYHPCTSCVPGLVQTLLTSNDHNFFFITPILTFFISTET